MANQNDKPREEQKKPQEPPKAPGNTQDNSTEQAPEVPKKRVLPDIQEGQQVKIVVGCSGARFSFSAGDQFAAGSPQLPVELAADLVAAGHAQVVER